MGEYTQKSKRKSIVPDSTSSLSSTKEEINEKTNTDDGKGKRNLKVSKKRLLLQNSLEPILDQALEKITKEGLLDEFSISFVQLLATNGVEIIFAAVEEYSRNRDIHDLLETFQLTVKFYMQFVGSDGRLRIDEAIATNFLNGGDIEIDEEENIQTNED